MKLTWRSFYWCAGERISARRKVLDHPRGEHGLAVVLDEEWFYFISGLFWQHRYAGYGD